MDLQEQIKAYTAWVNSQLKKRSSRIDNLSLDLCDGCHLVSVVEIVSGQDLHGIEPTTEEEKIENVTKVINFMKNNGIKLHYVSAEEIVSGNVKTIMQLILALAAHFKPASIGGRKHNTGERHHDTTTTVKHRWKNRSRDEPNSPSSGMSEEEIKMHGNMTSDLASVRNLAETLQKLLLEELEAQPLEVGNPFEENIVLRAKFDQSCAENQRLQNEIQKLQTENRKLDSEKEVAENRLRRHEEDLLSLRQDLLHGNLERDKLLSEKVELSVELEEATDERDRYRIQLHKKEAAITQLEHEIDFLKTENAILLTRKDKEIAQLQTQIKNSANLNDNPIHDQSIISRLPNSPVLSPSPGSPGYLRPSGSPKLSRRSPVSRSHPPRRSKFTQKTAETTQTRILYFTDRDMTPAMTTIPKRVGDITLGDFKAAVKKNARYRFIFKALDPELGTVKEEVFHDDDIIPGWEGKIVAWVEEELRV